MALKEVIGMRTIFLAVLILLVFGFVSGCYEHAGQAFKIIKETGCKGSVVKCDVSSSSLITEYQINVNGLCQTKTTSVYCRAGCNSAKNECNPFDNYESKDENRYVGGKREYVEQPGFDLNMFDCSDFGNGFFCSNKEGIEKYKVLCNNKGGSFAFNCKDDSFCDSESSCCIQCMINYVPVDIYSLSEGTKDSGVVKDFEPRTFPDDEVDSCLRYGAGYVCILRSEVLDFEDICRRNNGLPDNKCPIESFVCVGSDDGLSALVQSSLSATMPDDKITGKQIDRLSRSLIGPSIQANDFDSNKADNKDIFCCARCLFQSSEGMKGSDIDVNCPPGYVPIIKSDGTFVCEPEQSSAQEIVVPEIKQSPVTYSSVSLISANAVIENSVDYNACLSLGSDFFCVATYIEFQQKCFGQGVVEYGSNCITKSDAGGFCVKCHD